jgi:pimeloyl-ACP methyl ester carboxylesterase
MKKSESLKQITLPVLDIYGSDDLESVLKPSDQRKTAAKQAGNENYTVIVVEGADHFFKDRAKEDELIEKTTEWLEKL